MRKETQKRSIGSAVYLNDVVEQYTFTGLVNVALKAFEDGVISAATLVFDARYTDCNASESKIKQEIDYIKSRYKTMKEVFVIVNESDFKRIKIGAEVTLLNGMQLIVSATGAHGVYFHFDNDKAGASGLFLKGATVEQPIGDL